MNPDPNAPIYETVCILAVLAFMFIGLTLYLWTKDVEKENAVIVEIYETVFGRPVTLEKIKQYRKCFKLEYKRVVDNPHSDDYEISPTFLEFLEETLHECKKD